MCGIRAGRPTLIDAAITRLALPHHSGSPEGRLVRIVERIRRWLGGRPYTGILTGLFDGIGDRVGNPRLPGVFAKLWDHIKRWLTR